jgi:hypothetical protein
MMETRVDELNCVMTQQTKNMATELRQVRLFAAKRAPIVDGCPNFEPKVASVPTGPIFLAWLNHVCQYTGVGIMTSEKLDFVTAEFRFRSQPMSKPFRASLPRFERGRNTDLFGKRFKALVPDGQRPPAPIARPMYFFAAMCRMPALMHLSNKGWSATSIPLLNHIVRQLIQ